MNIISFVYTAGHNSRMCSSVVRKGQVESRWLLVVQVACSLVERKLQIEFRELRVLVEGTQKSGETSSVEKHLVISGCWVMACNYLAVQLWMVSDEVVINITRETWFSETTWASLPDCACSDTVIVPSFVLEDSKNIPNTKQERIIYFRFVSGIIPTILLNQFIVDCICYGVKKNSELLW